ncbi:hypothetical protein Tco_1304395 [Tanacetum coccineum]
MLRTNSQAEIVSEEQLILRANRLVIKKNNQRVNSDSHIHRYNAEIEQHASLVKSGRGKGFTYYGDQVVNVPTSLKIDVVPKKTRSQTIAEETVVDTHAEWGHKLKSPAVDDPTVQSFSDKPEESANETDDAGEYDMDLSDDNPKGDDDAVGYGVFMHNKSTVTPNSTYLSLTVTSSSLDFFWVKVYPGKVY